MINDTNMRINSQWINGFSEFQVAIYPARKVAPLPMRLSLIILLACIALISVGSRNGQPIISTISLMATLPKASLIPIVIRQNTS